MDGRLFTSDQWLTGFLLIFSSIIFLVAGTLYTIRAIWEWPVGGTLAYYRWERGFVIAALLTAVMGLTLLERILEGAGDHRLAPMGMVFFLLAASLALVAESLSLSNKAMPYPPIVVFVLLAFLGQALFGGSLLQTGYLPAWIGWATIIWNLAWLVIMPIASPKDMYFPWLHYVGPLLIGIGMLLKK